MKLLRSLAVLLGLVAVTLPVAAKHPVNTGAIGRLAIQGYDPVAYFTRGEPIRGEQSHSYEWRDAVWRFASAQNRERFIAQPERFAPAYGGFCAAAMARNNRSDSDPELWKIDGGRIFLFYSERARQQWAADPQTYIQGADRHWRELTAD